jgi:hypothetical protein
VCKKQDTCVEFHGPSRVVANTYIPSWCQIRLVSYRAEIFLVGPNISSNEPQFFGKIRAGCQTPVKCIQRECQTPRKFIQKRLIPKENLVRGGWYLAEFVKRDLVPRVNFFSGVSNPTDLSRTPQKNHLKKLSEPANSCKGTLFYYCK